MAHENGYEIYENKCRVPVYPKEQTYSQTEVDAKTTELSQSIKDEPLFFNLTTESFVVDGYLDDELKKGAGFNTADITVQYSKTTD